MSDQTLKNLEAFALGKRRGLFLIRKGILIPQGADWCKQQCRIFMDYTMIEFSPLEETAFCSGLMRAYGEKAERDLSL